MVLKIKKEKKKEESIKIKLKFATTFWQQAKGLMFTRKKNFNFALIFPLQYINRFLNSVHMLFVFYKILVVFLDENKKVVDYKLLKPFSFYIPKKDCAYLLEMPIEFEKKIKIGKKISWE